MIIFASKVRLCVYIVGTHVMLGSVEVNFILLVRPLIDYTCLYLSLHTFTHCALSQFGHIFQ